MLQRFSKITKRFLGLSREMQTPVDTRAEFLLKFEEIPVGVLRVEDGEWTFRYSEEFRLHPELSPIVEFPDVNRQYKSADLWPFFQMRIPSRKQSSVEKIIQSEQIKEHDEIRLLSRFGRRTIANPYELVCQ